MDDPPVLQFFKYKIFVWLVKRIAGENRGSTPRVGQRVRHKVSGTIWKVIEEKEVWMPGKNQTPGAPQVVPAIHLRYWKPRPGQPLGKGRTMSHYYAPGDYSFYHHWEILEA